MNEYKQKFLKPHELFTQYSGPENPKVGDVVTSCGQKLKIIAIGHIGDTPEYWVKFI